MSDALHTGRELIKYVNAEQSGKTVKRDVKEGGEGIPN